MIGVKSQTAVLSTPEFPACSTPSFLAILRGPDHCFEFCNEAFVQMIGPRPRLGCSFAEACPIGVQMGFAALLDGVYRTARPYRVQNCRIDFQRPGETTGQRRVLTFQLQPMLDAQGSVTGIYLEGADLTHHLEAEATIERAQMETERRWNELESIYQNAPVGLVLLGAARLEYRRMNKVQAETLGLSPEQVLGRTVWDILPSVAGAMEGHIRDIAAGSELRNIELEGDLPQREGERRSWLVSYAPLFLSNGTLDAVICTGLETTELKRAERALLQNEKLAAVGRLAGSIAHEINNPLEAMTNLLFLARYSSTLEEAQEYMDAVDLELRRVAAITSQTLRFHRQSTEPQSMACEDLLGSALAIYRGRLQNLGVAVESRTRAHRPVLCFEGEIRQVLNNFVGNALDAMSAHGGRLLVRSREGTDWCTGRKGLWLTVADTGAGMSAEALKRAFEAFFTTKGIGGTGLGLWISSEIVRRHGGRIHMRSRQQSTRSGTIFALFLPFEAVAR
ncbi:MAG: ATP-binding protein [Janthinobacterium lividum]